VSNPTHSERALTRHRAQVRRLRIQQRVKSGGTMEEDVTKQEFKSALPLLPPLVRSPASVLQRAEPH